MAKPKYSSFRRIALAQWSAPRDGLIFGSLQLDVTRAEAHLAALKAEHAQPVSYGVLVGKAVALALKAHPELNARVIGRHISLNERVCVYYQVDVEGGSDLAGTVVEDADQKPLVAIARELQEAAAKIRSGRDEQYEKTQKRGLFKWAPIRLLAVILELFSFLLYRLKVPAQWLGASSRDPFGSVMVTNVGRFGIDIAYAPLVPWTHVPIVVLVGQAKEAPAVVDGQLVVRKLLPVSATIDHRLADGAHIGKICAVVREVFEHPERADAAAGAAQGGP